MELHFGVIRDKQEIRATLLQSRSVNRQLAICYNDDGKLIVKICTVVDITEHKEDEDVVVTLRSQSGENKNEFSVPLSGLQSIYPIRNFKFENPKTSAPVDWTEDPETGN